MKGLKSLNLLIFTVFVFTVSTTTYSVEAKKILKIFHAGSLSMPLRDVEAEFEKMYPQVDVQREPSGSKLAARKVAELKKTADIVAVSDYRVIKDMLIPGYADWYIGFARNRMVIVFTEHSKGASRINKDNWFEVILEKGVEYGRSDPNLDPCGYRTLLLYKLAERYYHKHGLYEKLLNNMPLKNMRPKETDLIPLLQSGELDYGFNYLSVAKQHGLKYLILPSEIDLSSPEYAQLYEKIRVTIKDKKGGKTIVKGAPILYGITVLKNAPQKEYALKFIEFLLSPEGKEIIRKNFQEPLEPPVSEFKDKIPETLKKYVK